MISVVSASNSETHSFMEYWAMNSWGKPFDTSYGITNTKHDRNINDLNVKLLVGMFQTLYTDHMTSIVVTFLGGRGQVPITDNNTPVSN